MKIKLVSDFKDYYDSEFDVVNFDVIYKRLSKTIVTRYHDLSILESFGFNVPYYGYLNKITLEKLKEKYKNCDLVIYLDEFAHRGEGKIKININDVTELYFDKLFTVYLESLYPYHVRLLQIYNYHVRLLYTSDDEWRSNVGNINIEIFTYISHNNDDRIKRLQKLYGSPLIALDGKYYNNKLYFFDVNIVPQLQGTGIEHVLEPKDVRSFIEGFLKEFLGDVK